MYIKTKIAFLFPLINNAFLISHPKLIIYNQHPFPSTYHSLLIHSTTPIRILLSHIYHIQIILNITSTPFTLTNLQPYILSIQLPPYITNTLPLLSILLTSFHSYTKNILFKLHSTTSTYTLPTYSSSLHNTIIYLLSISLQLYLLPFSQSTLPIWIQFIERRGDLTQLISFIYWERSGWFWDEVLVTTWWWFKGLALVYLLEKYCWWWWW